MDQELLAQAKNKLRPVMKGISRAQLEKLAAELVEFNSVEVAPGKVIEFA
jgi:hypothetical protein